MNKELIAAIKKESIERACASVSKKATTKAKAMAYEFLNEYIKTKEFKRLVKKAVITNTREAFLENDWRDLVPGRIYTKFIEKIMFNSLKK